MGSVFTLVAANMPATDHGRITVNGRTLSTSLVVGTGGQVRFFVDTRNADPGDYFVTVQAGSRAASAVLRVTRQGPLLTAEGSGLTVHLPAHSARHARRTYYPEVIR